MSSSFQALPHRLLVLGLLIAALPLTASAQSETAKNQPPKDIRPLQNTIDGKWIGNGICYGPHRDGQHPDRDQPTRAQVEEDVKIMAQHWQLLRMYGAGEATRWVLEIIREHKLPLRMEVGAWISPETKHDADGKAIGIDEAVHAANQRQVTDAIQLAKDFPELVWALNIGNETQVFWSSHKVDPQILLTYIRQARQATKVPVSTADDYLFWLSDEAAPFASEVDFIHTHVYAMWRGQLLADAVPFTKTEFAKVVAKFPQHPVILGEAGWATQMYTEGDQAKYIKGKAGEGEQVQFLTEYLAWTTRDKVVNFLFEAFDEKWKGGEHPEEVEKHWGVYESNRQPKPAVRVLQRWTTRVSDDWIQRVRGINWMCYFPTNANPDRGIEPTIQSIQADLKVLRDAGFDGLVTYGFDGIFGRELPRLAAEAGYKGLITGVWNPRRAEELNAVIQAAKYDIVLGTCVGNEGLGRRYPFEVLADALGRVRSETGKPVATTEEIDDYVNDALLNLGDWVFPNAHPVYHSRHEWKRALRWTIGAYDQMCRETDRFVWFKEVGVPTGGDEHGRYSPQGQVGYYQGLAAAPVMFAYFEAFDLPWKNWKPLETQWGLFTAQREPKQFAKLILKDGLPDPAQRPIWEPQSHHAQTSTPSEPFWIYRDDDSADNHFAPTGRQGDCGDVHVERDCPELPYSGKTCIHIRFDTDGAGPNNCDVSAPCRWAGLTWQQPPRNWGNDKKYAHQGYNLDGYQTLAFYARADRPAVVRFGVGGTDTPYGDSMAYAAGLSVHLTTEWRPYEIDLRGSDLSHVISGFRVTTSWDLNPDGFELFLDDIRFE